MGSSNTESSSIQFAERYAARSRNYTGKAVLRVPPVIVESKLETTLIRFTEIPLSAQTVCHLLFLENQILRSILVLGYTDRNQWPFDTTFLSGQKLVDSDDWVASVLRPLLPAGPTVSFYRYPSQRPTRLGAVLHTESSIVCICCTARKGAVRSAAFRQDLQNSIKIEWLPKLPALGSE